MTKPATPSRRRDLASAGLIFLVTLAAYFPALRGSFLWDDAFHVTKPGLRSLHGLWKIWFDLGETAQYYPVLHSAFWVEHRLWGDAVLGYHLVNIVLHTVSACLFGLILRRLLDVTWASSPCGNATGFQSGPAQASFFSAPLFAALLFALHPVCVESVAWIAEQKNTLSMVFYLSAALAYLRFRDPEENLRNFEQKGREVREERPDALNSSRSSRPFCSKDALVWYFLSLGLFILALLSKSVTATLPAALLVVLWWRQGRLSWKRDVAPLVPWLAIGAASGLFTAWVERSNIGATGEDFNLSLLQRTLLAGRVIWFYLGKLAWPANLIFVYPRWVVDRAAAWQYLFPLAAVALAIGLAILCRRTRSPLAAFLLIAGSLAPVLGFVNVYPFKYSFVADHYQYLATLGFCAFVAGAWGAWKAGRSKGIAALLVLGALFSLSFRQARMYRGPETLYRATLARNPECWWAYNNLGDIMLDEGRPAEALADYQAVLRFRPGDAIPHNNLGNVLAKLGSLPEAMAQYREALRIQPFYPDAMRNYAVALRRAGRLPESVAECEAVLRLVPGYPEARADLARALAAEGRLPEALADFAWAVRLQPGNAQIYSDYGTALSRAGRDRDAIGAYTEALRLKPDNPEVCNNLGVALAQANRLPEALALLREAVRLKPDYADARDNLGLVLQAMGKPGEPNP